MKNVFDIENLKGTKVLVRVDFNVPIQNGRVMDDYRIQKALPTITYLREKGARIILISHIENPEGVEGGTPTLQPVASYMSTHKIPVTFVPSFRRVYEQTEIMLDGDVILLENIREQEGEKKNDLSFAKELASLGDVYVNEAFSVSHRAHASVSAITQFIPSYAGIQFSREVAQLSKVFSPEHPFVCIIGGAKFDTKIPLIKALLKQIDTLVLVGALANDALKAQGKPIGISKISQGLTDISAIVTNPNILIPSDVIVQDHTTKSVDTVLATDMILDAGPQTVQQIIQKISSAKLIVWNGPLGLFEKGFDASTLELAQAVAAATKNGAYSILGGGDTVSSISKLGIIDQFSFVSTGGGAMLDFLAQGTLPGIEALE